MAWVGPENDQCGQLLTRVRHHCSATHRELVLIPLTEIDWKALDLSSVDRLVLACETRLDYPWQTISTLQSCEHSVSWSNVPWGVVTSDWHAGARRTGLGPVTHWQVPWYRWWEAWFGWFFPDLARRGSLCPTQFEPVTLPVDLATPSRHAGAALGSLEAKDKPDSKNLLVVAACQQTAQAWQLMAEHVGWNSSFLRAEKFATEHLLAAQSVSSVSISEVHRTRREPDWPREIECVLWDDSALDRMPGSDVQIQSVAYCKSIRACYPGAPLLAALTLGHLTLWPALRQVGVSDFFIKPSFGLPLSDYLSAH